MKRYKKKRYIIDAMKIKPGEEVYNFLEDCCHLSTEMDCIKIIGTVGEEWLVNTYELIRTYAFANGTPITCDNIPNGVFKITPKDTTETIFAEQVKDEQKVITIWGRILTANGSGISHGDGDFIVYGNLHEKPNHHDRWVVNGRVFVNTYQEV